MPGLNGWPCSKTSPCACSRSGHQERLTRYGFGSLDTRLTTPGLALDVVNQADHGTKDRLIDHLSMV
jgi:hypothetical protein